MQRFSLATLNASCQQFRYPGRLKNAGVLIPIQEGEYGLEVVLTRRADHLYHHPGQVSFPGGKCEPLDANIIATALRETHEEIGVGVDEVEIIGQLGQYHTISGYLITPVVGFIPKHYPFQLDSNEVAEVFSVPLTHFLNEQNHLKVQVSRKGMSHKIYFMPYMTYNIWGATAAIIKDLVSHLK
ncbi:CoA pyrophosphatase [Thalassotalea mangrovi]|uniref:CoA pyrophosphatase n=1 Tax=Thalassotalea mangrovi TaxID=2572245 RepID=A0A4U1B7P4_9GAMM|nr:CoA pyrophosphatase [Thalassotalea mangrovi]